MYLCLFCGQLCVYFFGQSLFLNRYLNEVPENFSHNFRKSSEDEMKIILESQPACQKELKLGQAVSYLSNLREKLRKNRTSGICYDDVSMHLKKIDKEESAHLPFDRICDILNRLQIRIDRAKMRTVMSHLGMFVDEGCATERVQYAQFLRLLYRHPMPQLGPIATVPDNFDNKSTTYRRLCEDRTKPPTKGVVVHSPHPRPTEEVPTRVKDILFPEVATAIGLLPSDFSVVRGREEMERIFGKLICTTEFEAIWRRLLEKFKDQGEGASVDQFREEMFHKRH